MDAPDRDHEVHATVSSASNDEPLTRLVERLVAERTEHLQHELADLRERDRQLQGIYDNAPLLLGTVALAGDELRFLSGSTAVASLFGVASEMLRNHPAGDLGLSQAARRAWRDACAESARRGEPWRFEFTVERGSSARWLTAIVGSLASASEGQQRFWFAIEETTELRRADAALDERDELVDALIESAPLGVQIYDRTGASLRMNAAQRVLLGLPDLGPAVRAGAPGEAVAALTAAVGAASAPAAGMTDDVLSSLQTRPAPHSLVLERRFYPLLDDAGDVRAVVAFTTDVSQETRVNGEQRAFAARLARLTDSLTEGLLAFDREGRVTYANLAAERMLGMASSEAAGARYLLPNWKRFTVEGGAFTAAEHPFTRAREANGPVRDIEFVVEQPSGRRAVVAASAAPLRARDGSFDGAVAVIVDVTVRRRMEATLRAEAIRDPLTGLYNRRYMEESLRREIASAERRGGSLTVVMLDLDHFKQFNDSHGHAAGDLMLRAIGAYLRQHIRAGDIACRYGGEELTLIFPDTTLEDTRRRLETLRLQLHDLHVSYQDNELGPVTVSAGIAAMPVHGNTAEALLRVADDALYRAKAAGRDRVAAGSV